MIAMAMACHPALLIADEPTTALDVTVQKAILALLSELQEKHGLAIIIISHDLGVVAQLAHELAVMYRGEIVEAGPASSVFGNPRHPYTRGLLACRPPFGARLKKLPTLAEFINGTTSDSGNAGDLVSRAERKARLDRLYGQEPLLQVKQLSTWFPKRKDLWGRAMGYMKAVEEVSIEVFPGETLGLVGESGCGKTTLGRTMLRLVKATGGDILYRGISISGPDKSARKALRKQMQIIFQDPYSSLNPRLTAGECILEPMRVHRLHGNDRARKEKVMELLAKTGLEEQHYYRYPHEFSGGQRQRICIARSLAVEPEFIVCDESVSALDISIQAQVLNLLNQLKQEFGLTYIFISHDLSVVRYMSDRIVVMKDGRIVEFGDADEVCSNPKTSYTQRLIAAVPGITKVGEDF
jgi:peptide/nickel transport system ATP-binding protein